MNTASRIWDIPPPPGTEDVQLEVLDSPIEPPEKEKSEEKEPIMERPIDKINPFLKNPEYIEYEKKCLERRRNSRSHSHSREKHRRRHSRSKSRSKDRHRRSRSRSRHRRRRYSSSRSRSRSSSYRRHRYGNKRRKSPRYSRSRSKSRSASRSRQNSRRSKSYKEKKSPPSRKSSSEDVEKYPLDVDTREVDMKIEDDEDDINKDNVFKNDGSFLEMFKKMQEQQKVKESPPPETTKKPLPLFGKRRGGKVLKTGLVQKVKKEQSEQEASAADAWSVYMKEVRKYKEACCDDDSKTRPLVK